MKFVGQLLGAHRARHPAMGLADVYKLLHQAALGSAHAVDADNARSRLETEIATMGPGPDEPLADVISPDGRLARVHLRTFVARGLDVPALAAAFAGTATSYAGSPEKLAKFCGCLGDFADTGGIPFARADVETYMRARQSEGWAAVHHSDAYKAAYAPAYRVIDIELMPGLVP
jgi:hypothetical protein